MLARTTLLALLTAASSLGVPAGADDVEYAGHGCGYATTPTTELVWPQEEADLVGYMDCGPLVVADLVDGSGAGPAHVALASGRITGWVQVNLPPPDESRALPGSRCSAEFGQLPVWYTACVIGFRASLVDNLYLCVRVEIEHAGHHETVYFDDDGDPSNGVQCKLPVGEDSGTWMIDDDVRKWPPWLRHGR